jgi:hypothetical protein
MQLATRWDRNHWDIHISIATWVITAIDTWLQEGWLVQSNPIHRPTNVGHLRLQRRLGLMPQPPSFGKMVYFPQGSSHQLPGDGGSPSSSDRLLGLTEGPGDPS